MLETIEIILGLWVRRFNADVSLSQIELGNPEGHIKYPTSSLTDISKLIISGCKATKTVMRKASGLVKAKPPSLRILQCHPRQAVDEKAHR